MYTLEPGGIKEEIHPNFEKIGMVGQKIREKGGNAIGNKFYINEA